MSWLGRLFAWPLETATELFACLIDRPVYTVVWTAPFTLGVPLCLLLAWGAGAGYWGKNLRTAWSNEQVAEKNMVIITRLLAEHEAKRPKRASLSNRTYVEWLDIQEQMIEKRGEWSWLTPSVWLPFAPLQPWPTRLALWYVVYQLHHFFLASIFGPVAGGYLIVGLFLGWKESYRRADRRQRAAARRRPQASQQAPAPPLPVPPPIPPPPAMAPLPPKPQPVIIIKAQQRPKYGIILGPRARQRALAQQAAEAGQWDPGNRGGGADRGTD